MVDHKGNRGRKAMNPVIDTIGVNAWLVLVAGIIAVRTVFKFGHTILTFRKLLADQERASKYRRDSTGGIQHLGKERESHSSHSSNRHATK